MFWGCVLALFVAVAANGTAPTLINATADDIAYINALTMHGGAELQYLYLDEVSGSAVQGGKKTDTFSRANFVRLLESARSFCNGSLYRNTDFFLSEALSLYADDVRDKTVLIIGSQAPAFEAFAVAYGAREVVVVEYQIPPADDLKEFHISYLLPDELRASGKRFDVALSISSYEHDGLGRYGDPLDPNADLKSMADIRDTLMKPGGLLFLGVPIAKDRIVFNLHRHYGYRRLVLLTQGWELVDSFGFLEADLRVTFPGFYTNQPVFVLRAPGGKLATDTTASIASFLSSRASDSVFVNALRSAEDVLPRRGGGNWMLFPGDDGAPLTARHAVPQCAMNASFHLTHESLAVFAHMTAPEGVEEPVAWCIRRQLRLPNGIVHTAPRTHTREFVSCIRGSDLLNVTLAVHQQEMTLDDVPILVPELAGKLSGTVRVDGVSSSSLRLLCASETVVVDTELNGGSAVSQAAISSVIATWDFVRGLFV